MPARCALCWLVSISLGTLALAGAANASLPFAVANENVNNGIFDPSLEVDPASGTAYLAYSAVSGSAMPFGPNVETHLASSTDGGVSWTFDSMQRPSEAGQVQDGMELVTGFWNHEVPSLLFDPAAMTNPWKLITHRIFRKDTAVFVDEQSLPQFSWLELVEGPSPQGPWTRVTRLGSDFFPPAAFPIDQSLTMLDGSLSTALVFSEPSLHAAGGLLYLAVTGLDGTGRGPVVLLSSSDGGVTWGWVELLLDSSDAAALGFSDFDGSSIVEQAGRTFLLASPGNATIARGGTAIFEFANFAAGALIEDAGGTPVLLDQLPLGALQAGSEFGGQAYYHELASPNGILMNQLEVASTPLLFTIVQTQVTPAPEPASRLVALAALAGLSASRLRRSPVTW